MLISPNGYIMMKASEYSRSAIFLNKMLLILQLLEMEMKKYMISILTAVVMVCALTACADSSKPQADVVSSDRAEIGGITEMPAFQTVDLDGNEVDNSIFAQADVTVINVWGTFCPPCIEELPELAEWSKELPENVQIIGLVADVSNTEQNEYQTALDLVAENEITYTNILATQEFEAFFEHLLGVPTTLFVGPDGSFIYEEIVGADVEGYKKAVEDLL